MKIKFLILICAIATACTTQKKISTDYTKQANELAHKYIITDGHVDLPYRLKIKNFQLQKEFLGIPIKSEIGDFDFERAKKGGLSAPFMSIYIPSSYAIPEAKLLADSLINMVKYIATQKSDYFALAKTPEEVRTIFSQGKIALPMGMENGSPLGQLSDVKIFRGKGISYVTLTHAKDNHICDSSYDTTHTWHGLSPYGRQLIVEMAKQGIMIDISHVSDSTFYQVARYSKVPMIASHSSARYFTPGFERNMSDDMIKLLGQKGGVIMVNFGSTFLDGEVAKARAKGNSELKEILAKKGLKHDDPEAVAIAKKYFEGNAKAFSDIQKVADHIDRIVKIAGIDHVGFGSDFDGVGDSLPTGLKDVADYPNLIAELLKRGYNENDIAKICSGNLFRVWQQVIDYAATN